MFTCAWCGQSELWVEMGSRQWGQDSCERKKSLIGEVKTEAEQASRASAAAPQAFCREEGALSSQKQKEALQQEIRAAGAPEGVCWY